RLQSRCTTLFRSGEAVVRMLQHPRLQRINLLQCHGNQIDITPREGAIGECLVVTPLSVGALSKADEVQQRAVDVVFVARSIWRRAVRRGHGHGRYPWLDDAGGSGDASLDQHFEEARIIAGAAPLLANVELFAW